MISPGYAHTMARYNAWQNQGLIGAADRLDPSARHLDRGAFFGSLQRTFSHLLWADTIWMSRFDGWQAPAVGLPDSAGFAPDWATLKTARKSADTRITDWASRLEEEDLSGDLIWYSAVSGREMTKPLGLCVSHFFNHQTHHRGQIHAMLTAAGANPGDTDLIFMPEDA